MPLHIQHHQHCCQDFLVDVIFTSLSFGIGNLFELKWQQAGAHTTRLDEEKAQEPDSGVTNSLQHTKKLKCDFFYVYRFYLWQASVAKIAVRSVPKHYQKSEFSNKRKLKQLASKHIAGLSIHTAGTPINKDGNCMCVGWGQITAKSLRRHPSENGCFKIVLCNLKKLTG